MYSVRNCQVCLRRIHGSNFNGSVVTKIQLARTTVAFANPDAKVHSAIAAALGMDYTGQSVPSMASAFFKQVCGNTSFPHSKMNLETQNIMFSSLGNPGAPNSTYKFEKPSNWRITGVDFYRQYGSQASLGRFFTMNTMSSFESCPDKIEDCYLYYVETSNAQLFQGNGVYLYETVMRGIQDKIISVSDCKMRIPIEYNSTIDELISKFITAVYALRQPVYEYNLTTQQKKKLGKSELALELSLQEPRRIARELQIENDKKKFWLSDGDAKSLVNFMVGLFGSKKPKRITHNFVTNTEVEAQYFRSSCADNATIKRVDISKKKSPSPDGDAKHLAKGMIELLDRKQITEIEAKYYRSLSADKAEKAEEDKREYVWSVLGHTVKRSAITDCLIRLAIVGRARLQTYDMAQKIRSAGGIVTHIRTDSIGYIYNSRKFKKPYSNPKIEDREFGCTRLDVSYDKKESCEDEILQVPNTLTRDFTRTWDVLQTSPVDDFDYTQLLHRPRAFVQGYAGVGKSFILRKLRTYLEARRKRVCVISFTNTAAIIVKGQTCHSAMCLDMQGGATLFTDMFIDKFDYILIDEMSMIPMSVYDVLVQIPEKIGIYGFGDFYQMPPVEVKSPVDGYHNTIMFGELFNWNKVVLNKQYRSNKEYVTNCVNIFEGDKCRPRGTQIIYDSDIDISVKFHIVARNDLRKEINSLIMEKTDNSYPVEDYNKVGGHEFPYLYDDMPVIANKNEKGFT